MSQVTQYFRQLFSGGLVQRADFRRLWATSIFFGFGHELNNLALPLTAVLLLQATPAQMGMMGAFSLLPFALFSLPAGVWLDRRSKFAIILVCEICLPLLLLTVPFAYWMGWLSMQWLYTIGFLTGTLNVVGGSANQVFLTHLVGREQLIEAHSKFAATDSASRLLGPGIAGLLVQWLTAPFAIVFNAILFVCGWLTLRRIETRDPRPAPKETHPLRDMWEGLVMIWQHPLLWPLAWSFAIWQILFNGFGAIGLLYATRDLGMSPGMLGAMHMFGGIGIFLSSLMIKPVTRRYGSGVTILVGVAGTAAVWLLMAVVPPALLGYGMATPISYGILIFILDCSVMLMIMPYIAMRQRVTPDEFLGRMTATMRFMTVVAAPLGSLAAGWIGEHLGVRNGVYVVGGCAVLLTLVMSFCSPLPKARLD